MKFLTDLYWSEPNLCPDGKFKWASYKIHSIMVFLWSALARQLLPLSSVKIKLVMNISLPYTFKLCLFIVTFPEWNMVSVGLRRPDDDDEYYWNMNKSLPLSYEDGWWNPPDNNGLCVRLYNVGSKFGFDDLPCSDLSRYLCEDTTCQWLNMAQELDIRGANRQDTNASLPAPDLYLYNPHSGTCYMRYMYLIAM